jgi:hypothetical protein
VIRTGDREPHDLGANAPGGAHGGAVEHWRSRPPSRLRPALPGGKWTFSTDTVSAPTPVCELDRQE